jgi:glyoxylase-like metal-dependent hydrolase (beta-lactamase superfamily II)
MLTKEVGIFSEKGGTIAFLLSKEGVVVVDAQFPDSASHLITELKKKSDKPFELLINTHHHGDHTSGNIAFKGLVNRVLAHENSKINQQNVAKANHSEEKQLFPTQVFGKIWCEKIGNEKICLYYFGPAHTNGDALIHFQKADVVHMGDLVFNRRQPYIDRTAGANIHSWIEVLNKAIAKFHKKTIFVFGHSAEGYEVTGDITDVAAFRDYLGAVLKYVEAEVKAGKTRAEVLKATSFPGMGAWKSEGLERSLGAAYDELTSQ